MRTSTAFSAALCSLLIGGCAPPPGSPAYPQPSLVSVGLRGAQVCGPFTTAVDGVFAFTCPGLPTVVPTGWELQPDWYVDPQNKQRPNQVALIRLTTSSLANIAVTYTPPGANPFVLQQLAPGQAAVLPTISQRKIEVAAVDDGTTKTWSVRVRTELCRDVTPLSFTATGPNRPASAPLAVTLLRAPSQDRCSSVGGGGIYLGKPGSSSGGGSSSTTTASCPGGGQRQTVFLCLECPRNQPTPKLYDVEADEVCSAAAYLAQRRAERPNCDIFQVSTVEACVTPP